MHNYRLLFISFTLVSTICAVSFAKSVNNNFENKKDFARFAFARSLENVQNNEHLVEIGESFDNPYFGKWNRDKDRDKNKGEDTQVVVIPTKPPYYDWVPDCPGKNEIWSAKVKCDTRCDFEGDDGDTTHPGYDSYGSSSSGYYPGSYLRGHSSGCYRTVSDVLLEEGYENVTTRESLGLPPEPKEDFEARTVDLGAIEMLRNSMLRGNMLGEAMARNRGHHDDDDDRIVVIQQQRPPNRRPPGRCVCKPTYARLNGKCVKFGYCPCKWNQFCFTDNFFKIFIHLSQWLNVKNLNIIYLVAQLVNQIVEVTLMHSFIPVTVAREDASVHMAMSEILEDIVLHRQHVHQQKLVNYRQV